MTYSDVKWYKIKCFARFLMLAIELLVLKTSYSLEDLEVFIVRLFLVSLV